MKTRAYATAAVCTAAAFALAAEPADSFRAVKTVERHRGVSVGRLSMGDTYLSPETYRGMEMGFIAETVSEKPASRYALHILHRVSAASAANRSVSGKELYAAYRLQTAFMRKHPAIAGKLQIKAGVAGMAEIGGVYNVRNSNNPAQASIGVGVGAAAAARYRFRLCRRPLAAEYRATAQLAGLSFSPNYGQSYYEIFGLGQYDRNIVATTIFSASTLRHSASLDIPLRGFSVRVGYTGEYVYSRVNSIKSFRHTSSISLGIVRKVSISAHSE